VSEREKKINTWGIQGLVWRVDLDVNLEEKITRSDLWERAIGVKVIQKKKTKKSRSRNELQEKGSGPARASLPRRACGTFLHRKIGI